MANTRDILGDQATLDGLINHTLISLEEEEVTTIKERALWHNSSLISVSFPNLIIANSYMMQECSVLEDIDMPLVNQINRSAFIKCSSLKNGNFPELITISNNGFEDCINLSNFVAPKLENIRTRGFYGDRSLSELDTSKITAIGDSALSYTGIGKIILPLCTSLGARFGEYSKIGIVDLTENITFNNQFMQMYSLVHLILRSSTMCILNTASALNNTGISNGIGWIYVPNDLVNIYKSDEKWSEYANQIVSINQYPKALQDETITDTWSEIFAKEETGAYLTDYSIGDVKYVDIGGTQVAMQIVAFDSDYLLSGERAKITWISKNSIYSRRMNSLFNVWADWAQSEIRDFLRNNLFNQIEPIVKNAIKPVTKTYKNNNSVQSIDDTLWIPSYREIVGGTNGENFGAIYTDFFSNNTSRIKKRGYSNIENNWWLRTSRQITQSQYYVVNSSGSVNGTVGSTSNSPGIVIGFCT